MQSFQYHLVSVDEAALGQLPDAEQGTVREAIKHFVSDLDRILTILHSMHPDANVKHSHRDGKDILTMRQKEIAVFRITSIDPQTVPQGATTRTRKGRTHMARNTTKTTTPAPTAKTPPVTKPALTVYPKAEEFTPELLKTLRAEFEALMKNKSNPARLEELRVLGKTASECLKAKLTPPAAAAPTTATNHVLPTLTKEEIVLLVGEMNEVMSLKPALNPDSEKIIDEMDSELTEIRPEDFVADAKHPEKKQFTEAAIVVIRKFGFVLPHEKPAVAAPAAAKPKAVRVPPGKRGPGPSAREILYKAWIGGEKDVVKLMALTNNSIKEVTLKTYLSDWSRGKYLPACATAPAETK